MRLKKGQLILRKLLLIFIVIGVIGGIIFGSITIFYHIDNLSWNGDTTHRNFGYLITTFTLVPVLGLCIGWVMWYVILALGLLIISPFAFLFSDQTPAELFSDYMIGPKNVLDCFYITFIVNYEIDYEKEQELKKKEIKDPDLLEAEKEINEYLKRDEYNELRKNK